MTYTANENSAESIGVLKLENIRATATNSASSKYTRYDAANTAVCNGTNFRLTYRIASSVASTITAEFTSSVKHSPAYFPMMNSCRWTGFDSKPYIVRLSISL